jgi:ribose transport system substrate-binding protein
VLVAGFDDIAAIKPMLADGRVVATADQHADKIAVNGIEAALRALRDHKPSGDEATSVDLVTH